MVSFSSHFPLTRPIRLLPSSDLQTLITSNERRMAELKQLSIQLQQKCSEPCKDTVEIQPITGTGEKRKEKKKKVSIDK